MKRISQFGRSLALVMAMCAFENAIGNSFPDEPVAATEIAVERDASFNGAMDWIDENTLLISMKVERGTNQFDSKLVRVDATTGKVKDLGHAGALVCTNSVEKIVSIRGGDVDWYRYGGSSSLPGAQPQLFRWNPKTGQLNPIGSTGEWNRHICRVTRPDDRNEVDIGFIGRNVRYLNESDGMILFSSDYPAESDRTVLARKGRPEVILNVKLSEIVPVPLFLAFRDGYLLDQGHFVLNGMLSRAGEAPTVEFPLITMTRSGGIIREHYRLFFEHIETFKRMGEAFVFPDAHGVVIIISGDSKNGGGIYLNRGDVVKRVWCTDKANSFKRECTMRSPRISPDGRYVAFFSDASDNWQSPLAKKDTLKILPLPR